jgi:hypothetical protein
MLGCQLLIDRKSSNPALQAANVSAVSTICM